jgi:hypothetical protein
MISVQACVSLTLTSVHLWESASEAMIAGRGRLLRRVVKSRGGSERARGFSVYHTWPLIFFCFLHNLRTTAPGPIETAGNRRLNHAPLLSTNRANTLSMCSKLARLIVGRTSLSSRRPFTPVEQVSLRYPSRPNLRHKTLDHAL